MMGHLAKQREQRHMEVTILVNAILSAAAAMAGGKSDFEVLRDLLRKYTDLLYPEDAHDIEEKASRVKRLLEREFEKGPMKVQAQEYGKKRRKKRG